jgi:hypothetical protein
MQFAAIPGVWSAHPHNWVLQLASEWGLPALGLTLVGLGVSVRRAAAAARVSPQPAAVSSPFVWSSAIALTYGLVDGNLVMPVSQTAAALAFGAAIGGFALNGTGVPVRYVARARIEALIALVFVVACSIHLASFATRELKSATAIEHANTASGVVSWPRFWSDGFVPLGAR